MTAFPDTSTTLLANLAYHETGIDQAAWYRFFAMYQPIMVEFAMPYIFSKPNKKMRYENI